MKLHSCLCAVFQKMERFVSLVVLCIFVNVPIVRMQTANTSSTTTSTTTTTTSTSTTVPIPPKWFPVCGNATGPDDDYLQTLQRWYLVQEGSTNLCVMQFVKVAYNNTPPFNCSDYLVAQTTFLQWFNGSVYQVQCSRKAANAYEALSAKSLSMARLAMIVYVTNSLNINVSLAKNPLSTCYATQDLMAIQDRFADRPTVDFITQMSSQLQLFLYWAQFGLSLTNFDNVTADNNIAAILRNTFKPVSDDFKIINYHMNIMDREIMDDVVYSGYQKLMRNFNAVQGAYEIFVKSLNPIDQRPTAKFIRVCKQRNLYITPRKVYGVLSKPYGTYKTAVEELAVILQNYVVSDRRQYVRRANFLRQDVCRMAYLMNVCDKVAGDNQKMVDVDNNIVRNTYNLLVDTFRARDKYIANDYLLQWSLPQDFHQYATEYWAMGKAGYDIPDYIAPKLRAKYYWAGITVVNLIMYSHLSWVVGNAARVSMLDTLSNCYIRETSNSWTYAAIAYNPTAAGLSTFNADVEATVNHAFGKTNCDYINANKIQGTVSQMQPSFVATGIMEAGYERADGFNAEINGTVGLLATKWCESNDGLPLPIVYWDRPFKYVVFPQCTVLD